MRVADGLREVPLTIEPSWEGPEYATRVPTPATFRNWTLVFEIATASDEILVARYLRTPDGLRFGKTYRSGADTVQTVDLGIDWHSYGTSDLVSISFTGANDFAVEDREFGLDPQRWVEVPSPNTPRTGAAIRLATIPRLGHVEVGVVCVVKADTRNTHGRWVLREPLRETLHPEYRFLSTGAVSGDLE